MATQTISNVTEIYSLWKIAQQQTTALDTLVENALPLLEDKKNKEVPLSKNPSLQNKLNEIHGVYKNQIEKSIDNLADLSEAANETMALFDQNLDFAELCKSVQKITKQINELQNQHAIFIAEIQQSEAQIFGLMNKS